MMIKTLTTATVLAAVLSAPSLALANPFHFRATASGAQERVGDPPQDVDTEGSARGQFRFSRDLSELGVRVRVKNLSEALGSGVTVTHIHCGIAGQNGPVIVDLLPVSGVTRGLIVDDVFTNADLNTDDPNSSLPICEAQCGFEINNIASLYTAAGVSCLYLNVHSEFSPQGEVRGQLLPGE